MSFITEPVKTESLPQLTEAQEWDLLTKDQNDLPDFEVDFKKHQVITLMSKMEELSAEATNEVN